MRPDDGDDAEHAGHDGRPERPVHAGDDAAMSELDITTLYLHRPGIRAALGDLEAEIMELVWQRPSGQGITVRQIWEELHPRRPLMYTTIMNTMTRLARKGLLEAERKEPAYVYRAAVMKDGFVDRIIGEALEGLLVNFGEATAEQIRRVSDPALQERLARLLDEIQLRRTSEETD
ncbi:MAG: hypothetical protein GEU73_12970 [Chloroflexi bacterium]|nr:hypothetical protein [Chloroflexota bacterium]